MTKPKWFKTSPESIRVAVMLYVRFSLSLRNVEDLLHERGIDVRRETIRFWWDRFGPLFASEIRKRRVDGMRSSRWRWHLDEVFVKIQGDRHYLWRAVDHEVEVLEAFVTKQRDRKAALKFMRKLMKRHGHAEVIVTDKLRSYGAAARELGIRRRENEGRWTNNRAKTLISHSDKVSGRCSAFAECEVCRSSPPLTPPSTTTSTRIAVFQAGPSSKRTVQPRSPSGGVSARPENGRPGAN